MNIAFFSHTGCHGSPAQEKTGECQISGGKAMAKESEIFCRKGDESSCLLVKFHRFEISNNDNNKTGIYLRSSYCSTTFVAQFFEILGKTRPKRYLKLKYSIGGFEWFSLSCAEVPLFRKFPSILQKKWFSFCCKFLQILMVSDKTMHKTFRIHKTLWTKPIRDPPTPTLYQNSTLVLEWQSWKLFSVNCIRALILCI